MKCSVHTLCRRECTTVTPEMAGACVGGRTERSFFTIFSFWPPFLPVGTRSPNIFLPSAPSSPPTSSPTPSPSLWSHSCSEGGGLEVRQSWGVFKPLLLHPPPEGKQVRVGRISSLLSLILWFSSLLAFFLSTSHLSTPRSLSFISLILCSFFYCNVLPRPFRLFGPISLNSEGVSADTPSQVRTGMHVCVPMHTYGIRQKECNKRAVAALISTAYRAPRLSLCVRRTFTQSLKVRRLEKRRNPNLDCGAFPVKTRCVSPNRGALAKSAAIRFPHKFKGKP